MTNQQVPLAPEFIEVCQKLGIKEDDYEYYAEKLGNFDSFTYKGKAYYICGYFDMDLMTKIAADPDMDLLDWLADTSGEFSTSDDDDYETFVTEQLQAIIDDDELNKKQQ